MQTGRAQGMMTFEGSVNELMRKELVSKEVGTNFLRRRGGHYQSGSGSPGIRLANN
jgi:Tfp pilus assembly pilus retraction ATPase PilT